MTNRHLRPTVQSLSGVLLLAAPFIAAPLTVRPLRVPGVHQAIGVLVFTALCIAAAARIAGPLRNGGSSERLGVLVGLSLMSPFALIALLWTGLGTPWEATPDENRMRYTVLMVCATLVTSGFAALAALMWDTGEQLWTPIAAAAGLVAGSVYLLWFAIHAGAWAAAARTGHIPDAVISLDAPLDTVLFSACALTYLATAAMAWALLRSGWLPRRGGRAMVLVSVLLFGMLCVRGLSFPDPAAGASPWYLRPGFIAGIPAVPWIVPHLIGAVVLGRCRPGQHAKGEGSR